MPRKPCALTKSQISRGMRRSAWRICQWSIMRQSSSVGPSRKALLLGGQHDRRDGAQLDPVGRAGEHLGVEADGAGVEGLLLGVGHLRQNAAHHLEGGLHDGPAPDLLDRKRAQRGKAEPGQEAEKSDVGQMCAAKKKPHCQASVTTPRPAAHCQGAARAMPSASATAIRATRSRINAIDLSALACRVPAE